MQYVILSILQIIFYTHEKIVVLTIKYKVMKYNVPTEKFIPRSLKIII